MSKKDVRESNIEQKTSASDCAFEIEIIHCELKSINKMCRGKKKGEPRGTKQENTVQRRVRDKATKLTESSDKTRTE